jgi:hypothetical protein
MLQSKNGKVKVYHDASFASESVLIVFHGTPLTEKKAKQLQAKELTHQPHTKSKIYMPYTSKNTSTSNYKQLIGEMKEIYNIMKLSLLNAKEIDIVGHSYGPVKSLAFLCAIMEDKEHGKEILKKVKNLHLYNGLMECEFSWNHSLSENYKILFFKLRQFIKAFLYDEREIENNPSTIKYLHELSKNTEFKPKILIAYTPKDRLAPNSNAYMKEVDSRLNKLNIQHKMVNDSALEKYNVLFHSTGEPASKRFEKNKKRFNEL